MLATHACAMSGLFYWASGWHMVRCEPEPRPHEPCNSS